MDSRKALMHINSLCDYLSTANKEHSKQGYAIKAAVLCTMHFIMMGISPLTMETATEEGVQPDRSSHLSLPHLASSFTFLLDPKKRAEALQEVYEKVEPCYVKAKAAYTLALHDIDVGDSVAAEKLLYEALFILEDQDSKHTLLPSIVSELGTQVALAFGDVLLTNRKYKYAIEVLEGALINMRLRGPFDAKAQSLARKIAMVASNNKDSNRALQYYFHILEHAKREGKTNEIVHVALVAANLLQERSELEAVESLLVNAMESLKSQLSATSRSQSVYWNLPLRLCEAYIAFSNLERGMVTIQSLLLSETLPNNRLGSFCHMLATIYSKKGWIRDACEVLDLFNHPLRSSFQVVDAGSHENQVVLHLSKDKPLMGFVAVAQEHFFEFMRLLAWCLIQAKQYSKALQVLEHSTEHARSIHPKLCSSFMYLKGVLHDHCRNPSMMRAPVESVDTLPSLVERKKALIQAGKKQKSRGSMNLTVAVNPAEHRRTPSSSDPPSPVSTPHPNKSDISSASLTKRALSQSEEGMKSAQQAFAKAAEFSLMTNDQLRLAKAKAKYVAVYLSSVFIPASFAHPGDTRPGDIQEATLKKMLDHAQASYTFALSTLHLDLIFTGCLNVAEVHWLLKKEMLAQTYWRECRDLFFTLYMSHSDYLLAEKASLSLMRKHLTILKRMTRLLLAFGQQVANENLFVLDSAVKLELTISQALDRLPAEGADSQYSVSLTGTVRSVGRSAGDKLRSSSGSTIQKESTARPRLWSIFPKGGKDKDPFAEDLVVVSKSSMKRNRVSIRNQDFESAKVKIMNRLWSYQCKMKMNFKRFSRGELNEAGIWELNDSIIRKIRRLNKTLRNPMLPLSFQGTGDSPRSAGGSFDFASGGVSSSSSDPVRRTSEETVDQLSVAFGAALKKASSTDDLAEFGVSDVTKLEPGDAGGKVQRPVRRTCDTTSVTVGDQQLASYADMVKQSPSISRLAYVLAIDEHVVQYVPASGFVSSNRVPRATPLDSTQVPLETFFVRVILNQNPAAFAMMKVLPNVSLAQLETFLVTSVTPKFRRGSLDVKQAETIDKSMVPVDTTFAFSRELQTLVQQIKVFSTDDDTVDLGDKNVFFWAIETNPQSDLFQARYQAVTAYLQSPIFVLSGQAGTSPDNPFTIHYMCKPHRTKKLLLETNIFPVSVEVLEYLKNATEIQRIEDAVPPSQAAGIYPTLKALFFPQADALYAAVSPSVMPQTPAPDEGRPTVTDEFFLLVCSPVFQIFPWEMMLTRRRVFRGFSALQLSYNPLTLGLTEPDGTARSLNVFSKALPKKVLTGLSVPKSTASMLKNVASLNFIVYHFDHLGTNNEKQRIQFVKEYGLSQLFDAMKFPPRGSSLISGYPFQTPLSEMGEKTAKLRKKYKYISFVDLAPVMKKRVDHPLKLTLKLLEDAYRFPVLVLPLSDLLEFSDWTARLMK